MRVAEKSTDLSESARAGAISPLVTSLHAALEEGEVQYCHWKSTDALTSTPEPDDDLDLLVNRHHAQRFTELLHALGFKKARGPKAREFPGVAHYYGFDQHTGHLIHVHAHYQLRLGHDATKNYRLPIEEAYVASAALEQLFRIPAPEFEFALLVIRMVIKHGTWDTMLTGQGQLSERERQELHSLEDRVQADRLEAVVSEHLPFVGIDLFRQCVESLDPGASKIFRILVGRRLVAHLASFARRPVLIDVWRKFAGRASWQVRRLVARQSLRKRLERGGALIALVGGDGAGKSTLIEKLHGWLSGSFIVTKTHLGKPRRSVAWLALKAWLIGRRSVGLAPNRGGTPSDGHIPYPDLANAIRHLLVARDRRREYRRAQRLASRGAIVLCDRYPLPYIRSMDGSRLAAAESSGHLKRMLAALENRYYEEIRPPDVLIVLRLDAETAAHRRADEDEDLVRARAGEVWQIDWQRTNARVIDAGRPLSEVVQEAKSLVWSRL